MLKKLTFLVVSKIKKDIIERYEKCATFEMSIKDIEQAYEYEEEEEEKPAPPPPPKTKKVKKGKKTTQPGQSNNTFTQDQVEFMLNKMRREWDAANAHMKTEDDCCSVSSIKSTDSTRSTKSIKDSPGYLSRGQRMYILEAFSITQLRNMQTEKGRHANGTVKKELVYSAVNLVKTRDQLIDFILSSDPNFNDDSD